MSDMIDKLPRDAQEKIQKAQAGLPDRPVKIIHLAQDFGLEVYSGKLALGISGQVAVDKKLNGESGYYIMADSTEPRRRQRFTYAHELAHFLLHKEQLGNGIADNRLYRSKLTGKEEVEANKLAADILMPLDKIDALIASVDPQNATIDLIADRFDVSPSAVRVRLGIPR